MFRDLFAGASTAQEIASTALLSDLAEIVGALAPARLAAAISNAEQDLEAARHRDLEPDEALNLIEGLGARLTILRMAHARSHGK